LRNSRETNETFPGLSEYSGKLRALEWHYISKQIIEEFVPHRLSTAPGSNRCLPICFSIATRPKQGSISLSSSWPDSSEAQAQSNLRNLFVTLRRVLPESEHYLSTDRQTLQRHDGDYLQINVAEFESALASAEHSSNRLLGYQCAVDLYAGDLLPGCYDEWILSAREQLREGFQLALVRLIGLYEQNGDLNSAILHAQQLLRQDPLLEENYRRLMRLHLANGDRAGVLNIYKQCARILKRELGIEPGPKGSDSSLRSA
jgi:DNA-binding SARP family transcriptional activator